MKNNNDKYKRLIKFGSSAVILLVEIAIYWFVWTKYYNLIIEMPFWRRGNWLIVTLYAGLLLFFHATYGGLKIGYLKRGNLIYSQLLSISIVNVLSYLQLALIDKKFYNPGMFLLMTVADLVVIIIWVFLFQWIYSILFPPRTLLVVYGERPVFSILEKLNTREDKYIISGAININKGMEKVIEQVHLFGGVIIGDIPSHERNIILKHCYDMSIRTYMVPKISDLLVRSSAELNLFDTTLLLSRNDGPQMDQLFFKRIVDIVVGSLMLIATLPIFILAGIAIKCTDKGPVFYRQTRLTKDGAIFNIIKFRTMRTDAEKDGIARLAGEHDSRITKIGRILRSSRLDELPQLINILKGEMSLVGPRPERPEIAKEYEAEIPEFGFRLKVKAGLTGYAQIYGKYNTTPYDKVKLDLTYIRSYSMLLDMKIILMTPKILFIKEATEGIEEGNTTASLGEERQITLKEEIYGKSVDYEEKLRK